MLILKNSNNDTRLSDTPIDGWEEITQDQLEVIRDSRRVIHTISSLTLQQIYDLEVTITSRRMREAVLGTDNGWLANVDAQIAALRSQL